MRFMHMYHVFFTNKYLQRAFPSIKLISIKKGENMNYTFSIAKRAISIIVLVGFAMVSLSACSPNKTQVGNWWYDQQWESASAGGGTDQ